MAKRSESTPLPALFEELEPRLLLSADGLAGLGALVSSDERELAADGGDSIPVHQEFSEAASQEQPSSQDEAVTARREIVFVDGGVADHEALVASFLDAGRNASSVEVVVLDPARNGIEQISDALAGYRDLDAVHVLSHGDEASLRLGSATLDGQTLDRYRAAITGWAGALDAEADLLLYGCNLAAGEDGRALIAELAVLTGADVAASDDLTGAALLGGDWELEQRVGEIESTLAVGAAAQEAWSQVLVTYTVTSNAATGAGSLDEAIGLANASVGVNDIIEFNIGGGGAQTIVVDAAGLPLITDTVTIDATTQPGYAGDPLITLDGSNTPDNSGKNGLTLRANDSTIKGFRVHSFADEGIEIDGSTGKGDNNTIQNNWVGIDELGVVRGNAEHGIMVSVDADNNQIGGTGPNEGNVVAGNGFDRGTSSDRFSGIIIRDNSNNNVVEGNIVGLMPDGDTLAGNGENGIVIVDSSDGNRIGGTAAGAGNVVSGNALDGIRIDGSPNPADGNVVQGNFIGTDITGTLARGNGDDGISIQGGATNNTIGGTSAAARNIISGNDAAGVYLDGATTTGNLIQGNYIGADVNGTGDLGNGKVSIEGNVRTFDAGSNTIGGSGAGEGNVIAFGGSDGVEIQGTSSGIAVLGNSIFSNAGLGIDINSDGNDVNDGAKPGAAPNLEMDYPVFTSASLVGGTLTVSGYVGSAPGQALFASSRVEIFGTDSDPGLFAEGETYLGFLTADANGYFSGSIAATGLSPSDRIVATATDTSNNTSEFAPAVSPEHAPTASNSTVVIAEDTPYALTVADFNFSDVDTGDTLQQIQITSLPSVGTLKLSGVDVVLNQVIDVADIVANNLVFTPVADQNGVGYDSFGFKVGDGTPIASPGTVLDSFSAPVVSSMSGLAFDGTSLWLSSQSTDTIYELDTNGNVVSSFAAPGTDPTGLTFDGTNLWLVDRDLNTIYELDTAGNVLSSFATPGTDSRGLTWDGTNLWLVEGTGSQIYELTTTGSVVSSFAWPDDYMRGITWDGTSLLVADQNDQLIYELNTAGTVLSTFSAPGTAPAGITFDGQALWHVDADTDVAYQLAGPNSSLFSATAYTMTVDVTPVNDAPTFATPGDGSVVTQVGSSSDYGYSVTVQPDGKSVVGGYSWTGSSYDFVVTRYNVDGSLDSSFGGGDGVATIDIGTDDDLGFHVTLQPDGKILLAGAADNGVDKDFALIRLNSDGTLDFTFDGDGIVTTDIGVDNDYGKAMALQADGKIVVAGFTRNGTNNNFAVIRYNGDGSLDTSFDGDGIVTTAVPSFSSHIDDVALQADGKIVVIGDSQTGGGSEFAIVRYNANGSLDTSFGGTGIVTTAIGTTASPQSIAVQSDGKILAAGSAYNGTDYDFAVVRYNANGTLDNSFGGGDGIATFDIGADDDSAYAMVVQPDGKILLSGSFDNGTDKDFAVMRLDSDGSLDLTFGGGDGVITAPVGGANDTPYDMALQADGSILLVGSIYNGSNVDFALQRFTSDGVLDTSFDPVNTLDGTPTFVEDGAPVVLDLDVDVSDAELDTLNGALGNYTGASLTLVRNGGANGEDQLGFVDGNGITLSGGTLVKNVQVIASFDTTSTPGELVVSFTDAGGEIPTSADVDNILRQITYANSSDTPPASVQIDWTFDDSNSGAQGTGGALQASGHTTVTIVPATFLENSLLVTTKADVTSGGQPGVNTWQVGDIAALTDPNLSFENTSPAQNTDGTFSVVFDIDLFAPGKAVFAQHYVSTDIQLGTSNFQLKAGDLLLALEVNGTLASGSTPSDPAFSNNLAVTPKDVFVFRSDTPGDYSAGTFAVLLESPTGSNISAITLIEQNTTIGDTTVNAGDFLIADSNNARDVGLWETADVGAGATSGTYVTLLANDANVNIGSDIHGLDLVERTTTIGGRTLTEGTILVNTKIANGNVGMNSLAVTMYDVFALDVTKTTRVAGAGNGEATASLFFDGSDVGFDAAAEQLWSFSLIANTAPSIVLPGGAMGYTESDAATVIDSAAVVSDPDSADFEMGALIVEFTANGTANDRLAIRSQGTGAGQIGVSGSTITYNFGVGAVVIGSFAGGTDGSTPLVVTLNANADVTAVEALARNVTYHNVAADPVKVDRMLRFVLTDGDGGTSTAATKAIHVSAFASGNALWTSTVDDVTSPSGAPGLDAWTKAKILEFGGPTLAFEPGTTAGNFQPVFDINNFASGLHVAAMHYVSSNITVGGTNSFALQEGDLIFTVGADVTLTSTNSIAVGKNDVMVFRPDAAGDYGSGTSTLLLDDPIAKVVGGISLVEQDTLVGDTTLLAGSFLLSEAGKTDIRHFSADEVGETTTSGTTSTLILGADIGIDKGISGLELVENPTTLGGETLPSGSILVSLEKAATVGGNALTVQGQDVFSLTVTKTTLVAGLAEADATLYFEGTDVGLDTAQEALDGFTLVSAPMANANDDPTGAGSLTTTSLNDNAGATNLFGDLIVSDVDAGENDLSLTVTLTDPTAGTLSGGGFTESGPGTGVYTVAGLTVAQANTALDNVTFTPTNNTGPAGTFNTDISVTVNDQGGGGEQSVLGATTLTITRVNDDPTGSGSLTATSLNDNAGATNLFGGLTVSDVDVGENDLSLTITLTNPAAGTLSGGGFVDLGGGVYRATGLTVAAADTALNTVTFTPVNNTAPSGSFATDISVTVNDQGGGGEQSVLGATTVTITLVNDDPTGSGSLTTTSLNDNAGATSLFGGLTVGDADAGENDLSLTITLSDPAAGTLNGGGFVHLGGGVYQATGMTVGQANTALDNAQFTPTDNTGSSGVFTTDVSVTVNDQGGGGEQDVLTATTVTITRVNDNPTGAGALTTTSLNDNVGATNLFAGLSVSDVDFGENDLSLTITLTNAAAGTISGGGFVDLGGGVYRATGLTVAQADTALDNVQFTPVNNTGPSGTFNTGIGVTVNDQDSGEQSVLAPTTVTINGVNDNPTGSGSLTTTSLNDNAGASNLFGGLSVSDVDAGENDLSLTITLTNAAAGTISGGGFVHLGGGVYRATGLTVAQADTALDNVQFTPTDNTGSSGIFTTDVAVTVNDQGGGGEQDVLTATTVTITRVNDNPGGAGSLTTTSINDNAGATNLFGGLTVSDVDAGENDLSVTITLTNPAAGTLSGGGFVDLGGGVYRATGLTVAQADTALDNVQFTPTDNTGPSGTFITDISVTVNDQDSGEQSVLGLTTVTITRVNDNPGGAGSLTTTSINDNAGATNLFGGLTVSDVDAGENDLSLTITLTNSAAGTLSGGGFVDLGGGVYRATGLTVAQADTALDNVQFTPVNNTGPSGAFTTDISVTVNDQDSGEQSVLGLTTVTITRVNDDPTGAGTLTTTSLNDNAGATNLFGGLSVSDADAGESDLSVTITLTNAAAGTISGGGFVDLGGGVYRATGLTVAQADTALDNVQFTPADNTGPSGTFNTGIGVTVNDQDSGEQSVLGVTTVTITRINDNPGGAGALTTTSLNDNVGATNLFAGLSVSDVDFGENDLSLTITLTNAAAGTISGGGFVDLGGGVYRATGLTVAQADTALDNVQFTPVNNTGPSGTFNTGIGVTVNDQDSGEQSVLGVTTVTITRVNDNPGGAGTLTTTNLNDNAGATNLFGSLTVSDVDAGENDLSVTITLTNAGAGTLSGGGFVDLGGGVYRATGLTVAQADTALDNVQFTPANNTGPSGTFNTGIGVTVNDQGGGGEQPVLGVTTVTITRVNVGPVGQPVIMGTPTEDLVLTANTGGISDADGLGPFSYQWLRDGLVIGGATFPSYTLGDADVGAAITLRVDYIDGDGLAESVISVAVGPVANINDLPTGQPIITGTPTEDLVLSANTGAISDADGLTSFSNQWLRDGAAIAGATGTTYTLGDADVGAQISMRVSYTDGHGTPEVVTSVPTAPVANVNDVPTGAPVLSGVALAGATLSADVSGIGDDDGLGVFGYQWLRDGVPVGGATGATYTLGASDVGRQISVTVTYTDAQGTPEGPIVSAPTALVGTRSASESEPTPEPVLPPGGEPEGEPPPDAVDLSTVLPGPREEPVELTQQQEEAPGPGGQGAPQDPQGFLESVVALLDAPDASSAGGNDDAAPGAAADARTLLLQAAQERVSSRIQAGEIELRELTDPRSAEALLAAEVEQMVAEMAQRGEQQIVEQELRQQVIKGTLGTLSVGSLTWLLRAGSLLTGVFSALPVWTSMDPLPILSMSRKEQQRRRKELAKQGSDDEGEQRMGRLLGAQSEEAESGER